MDPVLAASGIAALYVVLLPRHYDALSRGGTLHYLMLPRDLASDHSGRIFSKPSRRQSHDVYIQYIDSSNCTGSMSFICLKYGRCTSIYFSKLRSLIVQSERREHKRRSSEI